MKARRRRRALAGLVTAATVTLAGCVKPATGADSYHGKASMSVEAATSEVETVRLAIKALLEDRILQPYADETITARPSPRSLPPPRTPSPTHGSPPADPMRPACGIH